MERPRLAVGAQVPAVWLAKEMTVDRAGRCAVTGGQPGTDAEIVDRSGMEGGKRGEESILQVGPPGRAGQHRLPG